MFKEGDAVVVKSETGDTRDGTVVAILSSAWESDHRVIVKHKGFGGYISDNTQAFMMNGTQRVSSVTISKRPEIVYLSIYSNGSTSGWEASNCRPNATIVIAANRHADGRITDAAFVTKT